YTLAAIDPPPNRPPVFTSVPIVSANVGVQYSYKATAFDPDFDVLTYRLLPTIPQPVGLLNPSFEEQPLFVGEVLTDVTGWTVSSDLGGVYRPNEAQYPDGPSEGLNVAFSTGATITQPLPLLLEGQTRYELKVDVGTPSGSSDSSASVELWAGG